MTSFSPYQLTFGAFSYTVTNGRCQQTPDLLKSGSFGGVEDTTAGADEPGESAPQVGASGMEVGGDGDGDNGDPPPMPPQRPTPPNQPPTLPPPMPVNPNSEVFEDIPATPEQPLLPAPGNNEEDHPPPGQEPTRPPHNGDNYGPVPQAEDSADPLGEVPTCGWFDYEYSDDLGNSLRLGGTTQASDGSVNFSSRMGTSLEADFPQFSDIKRHVDAAINDKPIYELRMGSIWAMGHRVASSITTQASYTDSRTVNFLTTNSKSEVIAPSQDIIMYKVQGGVTISGRLVRQNTVFNSDELRKIKAQIDSIGVAGQYRDLASTSVVRGDNHIQMLTIAYTRILALAVSAEMTIDTPIHCNGKVLNSGIMRVPGTVTSPLRQAVDAYLQFRPTGLVTLPPGSTYSDIATMLYLMGYGRLQFVTKTEAGPVTVYSPFDRFVANKKLTLAPLLDGARIPEYKEADLKFPTTLQQAQDLLTRYVDSNRLWTQMAIARNIAWGMVISREFSSSLSLPNPVHSIDPLFNTVNLGLDHIPGRRVLRHDSNTTALIASGSWLVEAMVEVLFEGCMNTMEETAGIGPRASNFLAAIDTRKDDLGLELRIGTAVLPVVDRITGTASTHIRQYLDSSITSIFKQLAIGWEQRPVRISSYLATRTKPEDENLDLFFSQSKRLRLMKEKRFTWREQVVAEVLIGAGSNIQTRYLEYGTLYDDNISDVRKYKPVVGLVGTHQIQYMVGEPTLWDFWCQGEEIDLEQQEVAPVVSKGPKSTLEAAQEMMTALAQAMKANREKLSREEKEESEVEDVPLEGRYVANAPRIGEYPVYANRTPSSVQQGKKVAVEDEEGGYESTTTSRPSSRVRQAEPRMPASRMSTREGCVPREVSKIEERAREWTKAKNPAKLPAAREKLPAPDVFNAFASLRVEDTNAGNQSDENLEYTVISRESKTSKGFKNNKRQVKKGRKTHQKPGNETQQEKQIRAAEKEKVRLESEQIDSATAMSIAERSRILHTFPSNASESRAVDMLFPSGKDSELKRAPYTIGFLLAKLKKANLITHQKKKDVTTFLEYAVGGKNAWAVAIVQFITLNTLSPAAYEHLKELGLLTTKYEEWNDKWSNINDAFRNSISTESWPFEERDFPQCLYLSNFVGRPHREADWDAERAKRSTQPEPLKHYTSQGFQEMGEKEEKRMILDFLYAEAKFKIKKVQTFQEYYESRAEWMIRGSMSGEKTVLDTLPEIKSKMSEMGLKVTQNTNKVHVAEKVDYQWFKNVLDMEPVHLAKAHTKGQENGKIRSIQGSCYSHYVIGSFWSKYLETTLTLKHATMNKSNSQLLLEKEDRRVASADNSSTKVCLDYPDFGATHTCRQQALVLDCLLEVAVSQGFKPTEEFLTMHTWYRNSFLNQWLFYPDTKQWGQADMGMFSGVVQTTLINTVLNGALRSHAVKTLSNMGSPVVMKRHYELGDDGWAEFQDEDEANAYLSVFPLIGKELNPIKQLVSKYGSEYLREWYVNGSVYGCFPRALAMLVSGNVESTIPSAGVVRIRELYESYCTLKLRLADPRACEFYFEDLAVYEVRRGALGVERTLKFCYGPSDLGGLALQPIYRIPDYLTQEVGDEFNKNQEEESQESIVSRILSEGKVQNMFKASRDYINKIEGKFRVVWKHSGKARATAVVAASGIITGSQSTQSTHDELELLVRSCGWRKPDIEHVMDELTESKPVFIGLAEVEKQFYKATVEDRVLLSELSKLSKVFKFMDEETQGNIILQISGENNIPEVRIKRTLQSLKYLKGEGFEYAPKSHLSSELMAIYSQWKVVQNFKTEHRLPAILLELYTAYHI